MEDYNKIRISRSQYLCSVRWVLNVATPLGSGTLYQQKGELDLTLMVLDPLKCADQLLLPTSHQVGYAVLSIFLDL